MRRRGKTILLLATLAAFGCATTAERASTTEPSPAPSAGPASDAGPVREAAPKTAPPAGGAGEMRGAAAESARSEDAARKPAVELESAEARSAAPTGSGARTAVARPTASGLAAGFADDNRQFNYFIGFLDRFRDVTHRSIPIGERIVLRAVDGAGRSLANARVTVRSGTDVLAEGLTYADGTFLFFPLEHDPAVTRYQVEVTHGQSRRTEELERQGRRSVDLAVVETRPEYRNVPLDLVFVLDTTGSMGDEIQRLKTTIELINLNLTSLAAGPRLRFGMVLYKDRGDEEYVTRTVPLTDDMEAFRSSLDQVFADGGGDTPEDLESALRETMTGLDWSPQGIRLAFIITDAPPHLDEYGPDYTYVDAAHDARRLGIKIFSVGTGGLEVDGEYVLRQIAQYAYGKYIFLTYGETGESEGGKAGGVSHHTGANYQTDKLEAVIIRFAKEELAHLTDISIEDPQEYFQAVRIPDEEREATLASLFNQALGQLADYSSLRISAGTAAAAVPIVPTPQSLALDAEYFTDALIQALAGHAGFKAVERRDLQKLLEELQLQLSGLAEEANAARVGRLLGAEVLVAGTLYRRTGAFELFLKLIRVESGEILSVTKARIDATLGL